ncbi:MAG TPA: roadblock/LC7 domain-containing protein [Streptosporangiaceae bacterium]|nr:roadblock/LC7 domain-containing protein [Streptosporangiaceae bacterium]
MTADQSWMLDEVIGVKGVRHAVVLTADGLVKARSAQTGRDAAERLAAACAGLKSIGQSLARQFGAGGTASRQVLVEFDGQGGYLFVRGAGDGSHLAVVTEHAVDPGLIAQQMQAQVLKIGTPNFGTPARSE